MTRPPPRPQNSPEHRPGPERRGRRAIAPPPRAGTAATAVVRELSKQNDFRTASVNDLAARWRDIVGEKTARMCRPVKLTGRGGDGVLHVEAFGPAAVLVEANAKQILELVNTHCGKLARRLQIARAPARGAPGAAPAAPAPKGLAPTARLKLEAEVADIDNPQLKAALLKLGRAAQAARPSRPTKGS